MAATLEITGNTVIGVLVVDDHKLVRDGLCYAFARTSIRVVAATGDVATAIRLACEEPFDAMLLDLGWSHGDARHAQGFEILAAVRRGKAEPAHRDSFNA